MGWGGECVAIQPIIQFITFLTDERLKQVRDEISRSERAYLLGRKIEELEGEAAAAAVDRGVLSRGNMA